MSNFTTLSLSNGADPVVQQSFVPYTRDGQIASFRNLNVNNVGGSEILTIANQDSATRIKRYSRIVIPVVTLNADTSVYSVTDTDYVNLSFNFGSSSNKARREKALAYAIDLLQTQLMADVVEDVKGVF